MLLAMKYLQRPGCDAMLLTEVPDDLAMALESFKEEFELQLRAGKVAHTSKLAQNLVREIHWLSWPVTRYTPLVLESEGWQKGPRSTELLRNRFTAWRESLLVEQGIHYLRHHIDHEVSNNISPMAQRFWKTVRCPMLHGRSKNPVRLTEEGFEKSGPDLGKWKAEHFKPPSGKFLPEEWSELLLPIKDWKNPSPEGGFKSCMAWRWLLRWMKTEREAGEPADACWWSIWAPRHHILESDKGESYLVLHTTQRWGFVYEDVERGRRGG